MRQALLIYTLLLAVALMVTGGISWKNYQASARLAKSQEATAECFRIAKRIHALKTAPDLATETTESEEELTQKIEVWASTASIKPNQIILIDPLSPRRISDSDYLLQGVEVSLQNTSLEQLASFSRAIQAKDKRLKVSELSLSAPRSIIRQNQKEETWQIELQLTYLRLSPKSTQSR